MSSNFLLSEIQDTLCELKHCGVMSPAEAAEEMVAHRIHIFVIYSLFYSVQIRLYSHRLYCESRVFDVICTCYMSVQLLAV